MATRRSREQQQTSAQNTNQEITQDTNQDITQKLENSSDFSYYLLDLSNRVDLIQSMCASKPNIDFTAIVVAFLNMHQSDIMHRKSLSSKADLDDIFDSIISLSLRFKKKLESAIDSTD